MRLASDAVLTMILLLGGVWLVACGSSTSDKSAEEPESALDLQVRQTTFSEGSLKFLSNVFEKDREEFETYVANFSNPRLGVRLRNDLLAAATSNSNELLRANLMYLLAKANYPEIKQVVFNAFGSQEMYVRYRAVLALPLVASGAERERLIPLLGSKEPAEWVRNAAQASYLATIKPVEFADLLNSLGNPEVAQDADRQAFTVRCLEHLLTQVGAEWVAKEEPWLASRLGVVSPVADAFVLSRLKGRVPVEARKGLALIVADQTRAVELRQAAFEELARFEEPLTPDAVGSPTTATHLRAALVEDLIASRFDGPKVTDFLLALGVEPEHSQRLVAFLRTQTVTPEAQTKPAAAYAVRVLGRIGKPNVHLTAKLIEAVENLQLRPAAVTGLVRALKELVAGSERETVLNVLARAIPDERLEVAQTAAKGIAGVNDDQAVTVLFDLLRHEKPQAVQVVLEALVEAKNNPALKDKGPELWEVVRTENPKFQVQAFNVIAALRVLGEIGGPDDLAFVEAYCNPAPDATDVQRALQEAKARIKARHP